MGKPQRPKNIRVLLISGSARREDNCPGRNSKSRSLLIRMGNMLPSDWEIDMEDLGNSAKRTRIQSCKACVSTSMALCVWPCNCYSKNDKEDPDLMWDADMYARFDLADAWAIIGPINWYAPTSNLKLMFDRLVCMNGGNPNEKLIDHKDHKKAMALEHTEEWENLSVNHLEGRTAAFFCHGDAGGDELDKNGVPRLVKHKSYFDASREPKNTRELYAPLVWQCRYGGIEVPDVLWRYEVMGEGKKYSDNQAEDIPDLTYTHFDKWVADFAEFVGNKGKAPIPLHSAYGYKPPNEHSWFHKRYRGVRKILTPNIDDAQPAERPKKIVN